MFPFNGIHRCNHPGCVLFGRYTLIDALHGWWVYSCKRHREWAYRLASDD